MNTIKITSPGDLAASLPALLGFHPEESLVAVLLKDATVVCTVRVDLPDDLTTLVPELPNVAARATADRVVLALFTPRGNGDLPHRGQVALLLGLLARNLHVSDVLLIDAGRWWSYLCPDPSCCPTEGTPIPDDTTLLEAEQVGRGRRSVAASRDRRAEDYTPRPDLAPGPEAVTAAQAVLDHGRALRARLALLNVIAVAYASRDLPDVPHERVRAEAMLLLQDIHVRDYVLARVTADEDDLDPVADALIRLTLTAPTDLRPALAATAAALLAAGGTDPVGLSVMLDLADGQSLADLVRTATRAGFPPQDIRTVLAGSLPAVLDRLTA